MKFDQPAGRNPIDRSRIIGIATDRIDGPLKTTGTATYAYEQQEATDPAYGYVLGAGIARGRIRAMDVSSAMKSPGVLAIVTSHNAGRLGVGEFYRTRPLAGPAIDHYHQAIGVVVAETFEQARAAAGLVRVEYVKADGRYDLAESRATASTAPKSEYVQAPKTAVGDFEGAFAAAPFQLDAVYTTPDQTHAMMEPHATIAQWDGDRLTCWSPIQQLNWGVRDLGRILRIAKDRIRIVAPFIGGSFGGKGTILSDCVMAALGARASGRPVKVALTRALMINNTTHRPATIQRIRIGADRAGRITAIGHENWSGNQPGGRPEAATTPTRLLYAGAHRMTHLRLSTLDLPEGNSMRAPGEATGMMALEIAMDEMAEKLGIDPVEFRILNDTQVDPEQPTRPFSTRKLVECLRTGAERFKWKEREPRSGRVRDGRWLVGTGMASAIRGSPITRSAARVRLDASGIVTVETDMTDVGTGSYTIIGQTAAEMMGVALDRVVVRIGDSALPESPGSGGQWGAASATSGVYAACVKLRDAVARRLDMDPAATEFVDGRVRSGGRDAPLARAAADGVLVGEDEMTYGDLSKQYAQTTFGAHFVEVGVDVATGEIRLRRMLAVCAAGRILNPKSARSQVIGAMTMGAGAALMEQLIVDQRHGFFVNHDLAGYEVPVHADIPHQEVIFLDELDPTMSPMKAKGVGELGICGIAAAIANAVHDATGVRIRQYPITLDKVLDEMVIPS